MIHPHEIRRLGRFGALYNGWAALEAIAPAGWRVPRNNDVDILEATLIKDQAEELKAAYFWANHMGDQHGFTALPAGNRTNAGSFAGFFGTCSFWTQETWMIPGYLFSWSIFNTQSTLYRTYDDMRSGFPLRFVKEDGVLPPGNCIMDIDGNIYRVVRIGNQVWTAGNWKCTHYANGSPIPLVPYNWSGLSSPAMCYMNNDITNS